MTDYPVADLRDSGGRAKRILLALVVGLVAGAAAYAITRHLAQADLAQVTPSARHGRARGAWRFIGFTTGLAFLGGLGLTLAIANAWVKRQWKKHRDLPTAKIV